MAVKQQQEQHKPIQQEKPAAEPASKQREPKRHHPSEVPVHDSEMIFILRNQLFI